MTSARVSAQAGSTPSTGGGFDKRLARGVDIQPIPGQTFRKQFWVAISNHRLPPLQPSTDMVVACVSFVLAEASMQTLTHGGGASDDLYQLVPQ